MNELRIHRTGDVEVHAVSDGRVALAVPICFKRRSGRKLVTLPNGDVLPPRPWDQAPTTLQLALARTHRWLRMLETGEERTQQDLADREGVSNAYISRMLKLTTLAPDLVEAILDDNLPDRIKLFDLAIMLPVLWEEQRAVIADLMTTHEAAVSE